MKTNKSQEIITTLKKGNFYAECPCCGEEMPLKSTPLFDNDNFTPDALEIYEQQLEYIKAKKNELKKMKEVGATKSQTGAKAINIGFILERIAPTMDGFRFKHNDCRSLFDPIDYIIFEGLSNKNHVDKIFFVDIKTGAARLSKKQKEIKTVISEGKVLFKKY
jgi:predicted Holliday junction resolvase-like endonuclease